MHSRKQIEIFIPEGETISLVLAPFKPKLITKKEKSALKFIKNHTQENIDNFQIKRLNCDIPKQLHTWLYTYARLNAEYNSATDLVIDILGDFAKKRGFQFKSDEV